MDSSESEIKDGVLKRPVDAGWLAQAPDFLISKLTKTRVN
jgi:hypothetical protein